MSSLLTSILSSRSAEERAARATLDERIAVREKAELDLKDKSEELGRLRQIVADADIAEQAADLAEAAVTSAAAEWARAGASPDDTANHESLLDIAAERRRQAVAARSRATGVATHALPAAEGAVDDAKNALRSAQSSVRRAIGPILREHAKPRGAQLNRTVFDMIPLLCAVVADLRAIEEAGIGCGAPTTYSDLINGDLKEHIQPLLAPLRELNKVLDSLCSDRDRSPSERLTAWKDFVNRLWVDPDAEFRNA
jgi:hypothetical protein